MKNATELNDHNLAEALLDYANGFTEQSQRGLQPLFATALARLLEPDSLSKGKFPVPVEEPVVTTQRRGLQRMSVINPEKSPLDARKVMKFAEEMAKLELGPGQTIASSFYWADVTHAIFRAVVEWDSKLRNDFTTGVRDDAEKTT